MPNELFPSTLQLRLALSAATMKPVGPCARQPVPTPMPPHGASPAVQRCANATRGFCSVGKIVCRPTSVAAPTKAPTGCRTKSSGLTSASSGAPVTLPPGMFPASQLTASTMRNVSFGTVLLAVAKVHTASAWLKGTPTTPPSMAAGSISMGTACTFCRRTAPARDPCQISKSRCRMRGRGLQSPSRNCSVRLHGYEIKVSWEMEDNVLVS